MPLESVPMRVGRSCRFETVGTLMVEDLEEVSVVLLQKEHEQHHTLRAFIVRGAGLIADGLCPGDEVLVATRSERPADSTTLVLAKVCGRYLLRRRSQLSVDPT